MRLHTATESASSHDSSFRARRLPAKPSALPPLTLSSDRKQIYVDMERCIRDKAGHEPLRILEAGCGQKWPLNLDGTAFKLTAIDIDKDALEMRKTRVRDVDEIFLGDLRERSMLGRSSFDVIYNSFVLEHIDDAQAVMDNFMYWLAPDGLLVLRIPDGDSVYGLLTRTTPFSLHVLYKKYVQGRPMAGKPGHGPYPTYYHPVVSRRGIHQYCTEHGCTVIYESGYSAYFPQSLILGFAARALTRSISALALGRFDWRYNNLTLVIQK